MLIGCRNQGDTMPSQQQGPLMSSHTVKQVFHYPFRCISLEQRRFASLAFKQQLIFKWIKQNNDEL